MPKNDKKFPAMVVNTIFVSRPDPSGRKDKEGNPVHMRMEVKPGTVFEFTQDEIKDALIGAPGSLRDPKNESADFELNAAASEAALSAASHGAAAGDAALVARTAAAGQAKQPANTKSEQGPGDKSPPDDDDDL